MAKGGWPMTDGNRQFGHSPSVIGPHQNTVQPHLPGVRVMHLSSKAAVMAAGIVAAVSAATLAQTPTSRSSSTSSETLVIDGRIEWLIKSDVSALREGVIDKMEVEVGMPVKAGGTIGTLHSEMAGL